MLSPQRHTHTHHRTRTRATAHDDDTMFGLPGEKAEVYDVEIAPLGVTDLVLHWRLLPGGHRRPTTTSPTTTMVVVAVGDDEGVYGRDEGLA